MLNPFLDGSTEDIVDGDGQKKGYESPKLVDLSDSGTTSEDEIRNPFQEEAKADEPKKEAAGISSKDIDQMEYELRMREKELMARKGIIEKKKEEKGLDDDRIPNWPPFKPIAYHNIEKDIPGPRQSAVRMSYYMWLALTVIFFVNFIVMGWRLFNYGEPTDDNTPKPKFVGNDFFFALLYSMAVPFLSWNLVYKILYNSFRRSSAVRIYLFYFTNGLFVLFLLSSSIGNAGSGVSGWLIALGIDSSHIYLKTLAFFVAAGVTAETLFWAYNFRVVSRAFRNYSITDVKNEVVQDLAKTAVETKI